MDNIDPIEIQAVQQGAVAANSDRKPLEDEEFAAKVWELWRNEASIQYTDLVEDRVRNMNLYFGRPFGDEVRGRSQVVSSDAQDVVEWILPYLIKVYTGSDRVVQFTPEGGEDTSMAEQATDWCNYVFYRKNNGFLILYEWIKDALMLRNGIVKTWWDHKVKVEREEYAGLTVEELAEVMKDPGVEIEYVTGRNDPVAEQAMQAQAAQMSLMPGAGAQAQMPPQQQLPQVYDVIIKRTTDNGGICIEVIPPNEFAVNRRHNSIMLQRAGVCGHRTRKSLSDLKEMGFDPNVVDTLSTGENTVEQEMEEQTRDQQITMGDDSDYGVSDDNPTVYLDEIYVEIDKDGDGIVERYQVSMVDGVLLGYEPLDEGYVPCVSITPIIMPHRFDGRCPIDLVADIQHQKSTVMRMVLDSGYQTLNPRMRVLNNMVNLRDLLEVRPGGIIRMDDVNAVQPLEIPFIGREGFPILEYLDSIKENRTGQTRYNQGADANSLNKTAIGISRIMDASMQRLELMARVMAETGLVQLFKNILYLTKKYDTRAKIIRLRNEYVSMDPTQWKDMYDMTVNVGLGTGNKQEELQNLQGLAQLQKEAVPLGMVKPIHFYNVAKAITERLGHKDVSNFFDQPDPNATMPQPPNPAEVEAKKQVEIEKIQTQGSGQKEIAKAKIEADVTKFRIKTQADTEIQVARERNAAEIAKATRVEAVRVAGKLMEMGVRKDIKTLSTDLETLAGNIIGQGENNGQPGSAIPG